MKITKKALAGATMTKAFEIGYLQHGTGNGPFRTEAVSVKHEYADRYLAYFEGAWRRVHIQVNRLYIRYQGQRITIQIEGL